MKIIQLILIVLLIPDGKSAFSQDKDTLSFWKGGVEYQGKRYLKPA